jgi:hypothetical protein
MVIRTRGNPGRAVDDPVDDVVRPGGVVQEVSAHLAETVPHSL